MQQKHISTTSDQRQNHPAIKMMTVIKKMLNPTEDQKLVHMILH